MTCNIYKKKNQNLNQNAYPGHWFDAPTLNPYQLCFHLPLVLFLMWMLLYLISSPQYCNKTFYHDCPSKPFSVNHSSGKMKGSFGNVVLITLFKGCNYLFKKKKKTSSKFATKTHFGIGCYVNHSVVDSCMLGMVYGMSLVLGISQKKSMGVSSPTSKKWMFT